PTALVSAQTFDQMGRGSRAEGGRGVPVAKRAASDANRGGCLLLCHSLGEQLRRPLLLCGPFLSAAARRRAASPSARPRPLAPAGSGRAFPGGGLGGGAGGSLECGGTARGRRLAAPSLCCESQQGDTVPSGNQRHREAIRR